MRAGLWLLGTVTASAMNGWFTCHSLTGPNTTQATIRGFVYRGPVAPVCTYASPCEEPFGTGFTVRKDGKQVARFRSGGDGSFDVVVPVGRITVVPDNDAPISAPSSQGKSLDVRAEGLSGIVLKFDTGLR